MTQEERLRNIRLAGEHFRERFLKAQQEAAPVLAEANRVLDQLESDEINPDLIIEVEVIPVGHNEP